MKTTESSAGFSWELAPVQRGDATAAAMLADFAESSRGARIIVLAGGCESLLGTVQGEHDGGLMKTLVGVASG